MAKPKIPNQRKENLEHKKRIEQYCALIQQIYDNITRKGTQLALLTNHEPEEPFSFDDYPMAKEAFSKLLDRMKSDLTATIMAGTSNEWKQSNIVQDLVASKVLKAYTGKSDNGEYKRYYQTNPDALKAFQQRKIAGMNLSDRVWNLTESFKPELEMAITSAIAPGISAQNLSVEIKQYLNDPDLMFRRFRYKDDKGRWKRKWKMKVKDEDGNVRFVDCDKDSYKTDPGVYKSSKKNAMRLARTEINMAYRTAEQERWKQFDFVVGYEVKTTQNGTHDPNPKEEDYKYRPARLANLASIHKPDMCDMLAGRYPKDFHFTGWHPQCLCYAIPILKTEDEFWNYDEDNPEESVNTVKDVPEQFKAWVKDNQERIAGAEGRGTLPYFIRDNKKVVDNIIHNRETQVPFDNSSLISNDQELEKALGIKKGKPMTFEEANEMKGNPHYAEDESYRVNCQTCVVANEMRRRGFDVSALPNTKGSINEILSGHTEMIWLDENGNVPLSTRVGATVERKRSMMTGKEMEVYTSLCNTKEELMALLESSINTDGRYHIKWMWERPQYGRFTGFKGHIITAERINEEIVFYDPQNGKKITNLADYAKNLDLKRGIQFLRVDNLKINSEIAKDIISTKSNRINGGDPSDLGTTGVKVTNIKAEVSNYIKHRNQALTNQERISLDKEIISNENFVMLDKFKNGQKNIYATENITEEALKNNPEYKKNIQIAKKMANNGYNVYLLSNPNNIKSADMILEKDGKVYYTEAKLSTGKNSLEHNLLKGSFQAERVLVDVTGTKDTNYISSQLKLAFENNSELKEVKLLKGGREISVSRQDVENSQLKKKFKSIWERRK